MTMRDTLRLFACLLPLSLSAAGCLSDIGEPRASDVAGVYTLEVPGALQLQVDPQSRVTYTVTGGALDLAPFWRFSIQFLTPETVISLAGDYSRTSTGVVLDYDGGATEVGTLSGDRIVMARSDGVTIAFRKVAQD